MKKTPETLRLTLLIAALTILIGFLGELMPADFQKNMETWATTTLGISYMALWIIATVLIAAVFLYLVWKEALGKETAPDKPAQPEKAPVIVTNSKNVVNNSSIQAGGNVHIGDTTTVNNEGANIKNQFNGGTFNDTTFQ